MILKFPLVAATIYGKNCVKLAKKAKKLKVDLIELRVDKLPKIEKDYIKNLILKIKNKTNLGIIGTIRKSDESGEKNNRFLLTENDRLEIFKEIIPLVEFIDIELSANEIIDDVIELSHRNFKKVIISYHNFSETPAINFLNEILDNSLKKKADITKIAVYANNYSDVINLLKFTEANRDRNIITIGMGEYGCITRIVAPFFGSLISYGYVGKKPAAPGQLPVETLVGFVKGFNK